MRLREARRFHELLLEHRYFVPRDQFKEELASVEQGMVVVTKSRPEQSKLRKDSRLAVHWETMKLKDSFLRFGPFLLEEAGGAAHPHTLDSRLCKPPILNISFPVRKIESICTFYLLCYYFVLFSLFHIPH